MEIKTRPRTLDEMYFKRPASIQKADPLIPLIASPKVETVNQPVVVQSQQQISKPNVATEALPVSTTPPNKVNFFKKHWLVFTISGCALFVTFCLIMHKKEQKKAAETTA